MKSTQFLITALAFCLGLAACRPERKTADNAPEMQMELDPASSVPPSKPELLDNDQTSIAGRESSLIGIPDINDRDLSEDEKLIRIAELERAEVFDVPLPAQVAKDRAEAWEKLSSAVPHRKLKKEQYLYAQDLLERYRQAPALERLVFWRLIDLRLHHQGVSGTSMIVGDDYRDLRNSMYPKLMAMLYSSLGENPEKLPDFLAVREGIEQLRAAARGGSQSDN